MFRTIEKMFEQLSAFSKAMIFSGVIVCAAIAVIGFGAELYGAFAANTSYILRCTRSMTEGGFRCLLLGAVCSAVYEYISPR